MENKIQVNEQELMIKEYEGVRVVTMWNIAELHQVDVRNIRHSFERNKKYMIEGEDYFLLDKEDDFVVSLNHKGELTQNTVNRAKNIPVFTEAGYILMTKPMTDDKSWEVQRTLVNCYFKVKEVINSGMSEEEKLEAEAPKYILEDINKTLEILTTMYKNIGATSKDTLEMTRSLLKNVGIEIPEVKTIKKDTKNFITLGEVANRVGIYTSKGEPNKQAVVIIFSNINVDYSKLNISTGIDQNTNTENVTVTYSPEIVEQVSKYLSDNNYPEVLEGVTKSGYIVRCKVEYRR